MVPDQNVVRDWRDKLKNIHDNPPPSPPSGGSGMKPPPGQPQPSKGKSQSSKPKPGSTIDDFMDDIERMCDKEEAEDFFDKKNAEISQTTSNKAKQILREKLYNEVKDKVDQAYKDKYGLTKDELLDDVADNNSFHEFWQDGTKDKSSNNDDEDDEDNEMEQYRQEMIQAMKDAMSKASGKIDKLTGRSQVYLDEDGDEVADKGDMWIEDDVPGLDGVEHEIIDKGVPDVNLDKAPPEVILKLLKKRRLQTVFATVISKIAEDLAGWPIEGDDEWDIKALMERHISKRPLHHCRQSRERQCVVLIVDISGSCSGEAKFFSQIATAGIKAGDVDVYTAMNSQIYTRIFARGNRIIQRSLRNNCVPFDDIMRSRTIVHFTDFDSINHNIRAAQLKNKVYWFSAAERDKRGMRQNPEESSYWGYRNQIERDFKGKYYPSCLNEDDFMKYSKRVR